MEYNFNIRRMVDKIELTFSTNSIGLDSAMTQLNIRFRFGLVFF